MTYDIEKVTARPWMQFDTFMVVHEDNCAPVADCDVYQYQDLSDEECEANAAHIVHCVNHHEELVSALIHLSNEVHGSLGIAEMELRQILGNSNYSCIENRVNEARALLAKMKP